MSPWHLFFVLMLLAENALAVEVSETQIPDEYESNSAFSAATNNAGYAANDPHSAIRANPALLGTQKSYSVAAGYHWPIAGRDYYQVSVVDTKTSAVAAGVSYTSFMDDYKYSNENNKNASAYDSPLEKRGVIAMAHPVGNGFAGVGATYVRAVPVYSSEERQAGKETVQGTGLNLGFSYPITEQLIAGGSTENMSNTKIKDYAPKTHKAGLAYVGPVFIGNIDLRQRERVTEFEAEPVKLGEISQFDSNPEKMAIASITAKMQSYLKITGSYGQSLNDSRKQLGGGVTLQSQNFILSYTANRPYLAKSTAHQSIALVLDISM